MDESLIEKQNGNCANTVLAAVASNKVYLEDCTEALKRFSDGYFDIAVVDPPYGIGANKMQLGNGKKKIYRGEADWDNAIPTAEYWEQLFRVSKNQIVWGGNYMTEYLKPTSAWLFWDKGTGENDFADGELAWTSFNKVAKQFDFRYYGNLQGKTSAEDKIHPTQKPVALYDWLLQNYAEIGATILDTHLGSGSSRIAAYKGGFNFVGFEIDQEYYEKQEKRFNDFKSQLRLF
jgi:site-specific DNA-methyltransferase (adenine-specific)